MVAWDRQRRGSRPLSDGELVMLRELQAQAGGSTADE